MKILICGSRFYKNYIKIYYYIKSLQEKCDDLIIIEGGARGADRLARNACITLGIEYKEYQANWDKYGKAAGPIRNKKMLDDNPDIDLVVSFHEDINSSKGTKDMLNKARKKGIRVEKYK